MMFQLHRRQVVGGTLDDVFAFFKSPRNLEAITPPWLDFRVLHATDDEVRLNTRIAYRLRLHGIPFQWESRIAEYAENDSFADTQLRGPYRYWYHRHTFRTVPEGVLLGDDVDYELPLGPLGRLAHAIMVRRQVEQIFDYRTQIIAGLFPPPRPTNDNPSVGATG